MKKEKWKTIKGYNDYKISTKGRVKSLKHGKEKILCLSKTHDGYVTVGLCRNGVHKKKRVSRLVANEFISNPRNKPEVNHINGEKEDNTVSNLEWCTHSENIAHADNNNLRKWPKGEKVANSKLTKHDIIKIRDEYESTNISQRLLGEKYGVNQGHIGKIVRKELWGHV